MKRFLVACTFVLFGWVTSAYATSPTAPPFFTYNGALFQPDGVTPNLDNIQFTFDVYDPSGTCLLYEESQSLNLTATQGVFSLQVGSQTGSPKRTANDPALPIAIIFGNKPAAIRAPGANCASGYTPTNGDVR